MGLRREPRPEGQGAPSEGEERLTALLALEMSEEVAEASALDHRLNETASWPNCPVHPHSLKPVVSADAALWRCPEDASIKVPIGFLRDWSKDSPT